MLFLGGAFEASGFYSGLPFSVNSVISFVVNVINLFSSPNCSCN